MSKGAGMNPGMKGGPGVGQAGMGGQAGHGERGAVRFQVLLNFLVMCILILSVFNDVHPY